MPDSARDELVLGVLPWCHALANRFVEKPQDREDAVQTLVVKLLRGAHSFDPAKGKATTWTHAIAVRLFARPSRRTPEPMMARLPAKMPDPRQPLAEDVHSHSEECGRVAAVLDALPAEDAELIRRHVIDGTPLAACDRSVSREAVRTRYQRAIRHARRLLESPR